MTCWVYVLGERTGADLKIGKTNHDTIRQRLREVNAEANDDEYVLLAAVRGTPTDESAMREPFRIKPKGRRKEYIYPDDDAVEYASWLRSQWFTTTDEDQPAREAEVRHADEWLPTPERRRERPAEDADKMVQDWETLPGELQGTAWSWMPNPKASFQDYFTPPHLIDAAREAMGGIDLDAASHWAANKVHRIADYFDATRSAFENDWYGRVWLNPPYGENGPWFQEIERYVKAGDVEQLIMLSPVWSFTTKIARPVMALTSGMVLFSPTPKFWGNANPDKTGANHPHAVIYIGDRRAEFLEAYRRWGIPATLDLSVELVPVEP